MTFTEHYSMALATDSDQMSDVQTYLNDNWNKIQNSVDCLVVDFLPITDFSFTLGTKIYHRPTNSVYVLVASNSAWGNFWRPVQARYSPWIQPPSSSIIANYGTVYKENTTDPIQYMISNTGVINLRGGVDAVSANGLPDREAGVTPAVFNNMPGAIAPMYREIEIASVYPQQAVAVKPALAQISVHKSGSLGNTTWNPANIAKTLYYCGVEWSMGYSRGYGPDD